MSIWTDLLFQHGHIAEPRLARSLAEDPTAPRKAPPAARSRAPREEDHRRGRGPLRTCATC